MDSHWDRHGPRTAPLVWQYLVCNCQSDDLQYVTDSEGTHVYWRTSRRIDALSLRDVDILLAWDKIKQYDLIHPMLKERRVTLVYDRDFPPLPHLPYDMLHSSSASGRWSLGPPQ